MIRGILATTIALNVVASSLAGHLGFGGPGGFGGGPPGRWGGDSTTSVESRQDFFESAYEDLVTEYDTGLVGTTDFYSSEDYTDVVDGMERLVDRYNTFLTGVQRSLDWLGDSITMTSDDIEFFSDLLSEYESRDDLSEERLDRITTRINSLLEHLGSRLDSLTEKQSTLTESIAEYTDFSDSLDLYLSTIVSAGGGTAETDDSTSAVAATYFSYATAIDTSAACGSSDTASAAIVAPEPTGAILLAVALGGTVCRRPRRRTRRYGE